MVYYFNYYVYYDGVSKYIYIFPLALAVTLNVWIFSLFEGFMWSWVTSIIGSFVAFLLYRYWFQGLVRHKINPIIQEKMERNGFYYVLYSRLIPIVPTSVINIAAGISTIKTIPFLVATMLGNFVFILCLCLLIEGVLNADIEIWIISTLIIGFIVFISLYKKMKKRKNMLRN